MRINRITEDTNYITGLIACVGFMAHMIRHTMHISPSTAYFMLFDYYIVISPAVYHSIMCLRANNYIYQRSIVLNEFTLVDIECRRLPDSYSEKLLHLKIAILLLLVPFILLIWMI